MPDQNHPILELRVAITTGDYERIVKFYCDGLGLEPAAIWNNDGGRALMLEMGKATLELFDERQAEVIDQLEAGKRLSRQIRFALQVPDLKSAMERLLANGATLVHPPVQTPWGDTNVRLQDPDGMQITLFQAPNKKGEDEMTTMNIDNEKVAVKNTLDSYVTSVENADIELYAKTVVNDLNMVNFGTGAGDRVVGWNALRKVMEAQNAALSATKISVSDITINISPEGNFAWATSLWDFKATMGGKAIALPVRCTWILEKRETDWMVVHFHKSVGMAE